MFQKYAIYTMALNSYWISKMCIMRKWGGAYTIEKQRRVEINGDEGYWETMEQQVDWPLFIGRDVCEANIRFIKKGYRTIWEDHY